MATILSASISVLGGTLATLAKDEIILLLGVQDDIERFRRRLERMMSVLTDAERQQFKNRAIDCWLLQLRDVIYDAEDVIDECKIEGEKLRSTWSQRPPSSSPSSAVRCFRSPFSCFSRYKFRHQIGDRIKSLNSKLDDIIKDIDVLRLNPGPREHYNTESRVSRKTSPIAEPDIVGECIENDTQQLVDVLLSKEHNKQHKVSVYAIVGMGGIGKTTLAQSIFNNKELKANFNIKPIWVCVSQNFSEIDVLQAIIKRAGGSPGNDRHREDLEPLLFNLVEGKKFFLVLDDVWDARVWENLLSKPLQSGLAGSRVLVTTRDEATATRMGAVHCHRVEKMSNISSWNMLRKMVFLHDENEADTQLELKDVGMRIVKKCDGLPLALKTIAGVLRTKRTSKFEWDKVLQNPAWSMTDLPEGPMGALYLSYEDLPPHLKQCFVYFALFPEDSTLTRDLFVRLWVAEGFINYDMGGILKEELAEECWEELLRRNLLQKDPPYNFHCTMHDLLHSLARFLARNECFCGNQEAFDGKFSSSSSVATKPRRVNIIQEGVVLSDVIKQKVFLRTLLIPNVEKIGNGDAFRMMKCLRILDLYKSSIEILPDSIGSLVHLRFLRLSESQIREVPESIGNLCNLQYLLLKNCRNLHNLPRNIATLYNLRALTISPTEVVQSIPSGIGRLQHLNTLGGFGVCSSNRISSSSGGAVGAIEEHLRLHQHRQSGLYELSTVSQLITLHVYGLEKASVDEASAAALKEKPHLIRMGLNCSQRSYEVEPNTYDRELIDRITEVFEELCPPPHLEILVIRQYFGLEYPSWIMMMSNPYLSNLQQLSLANCSLCEQLPPLGLLPHLYSLSIEGASAVKNIGPDFFLGGYSCSSVRGGNVGMPYPSFPKLTRLFIINMPNLEEWLLLEEADDQMIAVFPCLESFQLLRCPKLRALPVGILCHAAASTSLSISGAHSLIEVKNLLSVKDLNLTGLLSLERVSNLPSLVQLWIEGCENLQDVERVEGLQNLELSDEKMDSLPDWLLVSGGQEPRFEALQYCVLRGNVHLLSRCLVDGPDWHKITHIPNVRVYTEDEFSYVSYTKSPFTFETNLSSDVANYTDYNDDEDRGSFRSSNFDYDIDDDHNGNNFDGGRNSSSSSNDDHDMDNDNGDNDNGNDDDTDVNNNDSRGSNKYNGSRRG